MSDSAQKLYQVELKLRAHATHFGGDVPGIGVENVQEFMHSDSLFSAICHAWGEVYGKEEVDELLREFNAYGDEKIACPPFTISSAFLTEGGTYYLPKPLAPLPRYAGQDAAARNQADRAFRYYGAKIEDATFIFENLVAQWIQEDHSKWDVSRFEQFYESILFSANEYSDLFVRRVLPVNTRDRVSGQAIVYHRGEVLYRHSVRLYFLLKATPERAERIGNALDALAVYEGVGGERGTGFGTYDGIDMKEASLAWNLSFDRGSSASKGSYLLSLWHPRKDVPRAIREGHYHLVWRKGWTHSPYTGYQYKKRMLAMFSEGSVLPAQQVKGGTEDVSPDIWVSKEKEVGEAWHRIYRYSIPMTAPVTCEV